ncbi:MAG: S8 family serine peptidase [Ignavibacteriae bacterium]|nr:S8 family serine peptidase [Ignavibacteriota bacterium]
MKKIFQIIYFINLIQIFGNTNIIEKDNEIYFSDRIILKFKESSSLYKISNSVIQKFQESELTQTFKLSKGNNSSSKILQNIFTLKFKSPFDINFVLKEISSLPEIEWAEPHYLSKIDFTPNDPSFQTSQHYLNVIKAQEAWDVNTGSEEIIIAIVDTGVDWEHPDLSANIWNNMDEIDNNGIDDDGNGFIDDIHGWDFGGVEGTSDNNPKEDRADHGTLVAGLASAVSNNEIGIASIGFKSKLLAVKTAQDNIRSESGLALVAYGYEGIIYAADNGAKIINCSWGSNNFSNAAQAVIDYAVSKGALVVAAAGNDNNDAGFYPANYNGVLSVAGTDNSDIKASWSNYGTKVDVCAPGVNVYSTWQDDPFYISADGTSLSSPITAGLAALVANQFPTYTPLQIAEQIRVNCDNIDNLNLLYNFQLGAGRINAYKSLTNTNSKSVRISNLNFSEIGDGDGIYESGETINISPTFTNYLTSLVSLNVNLETDNSNIQLLKSGGNIGSIATLQSTQTENDFFSININSVAAENIDINLKLTYTENNYEDFEWITISINPTYEIQTSENLSITFTSNGSIGFDDYPTNLKGNGLRYKDGPNVIFESSLIYGTSSNSIVSSARNSDGDKDLDFSIITPIKVNVNSDISEKEGYAVFNDVVAQPKSLGIETEFYTYSFSEVNSDFMFVRYTLFNKTNEEINNFYIGQYWDFDIDDTSYDDDMIAYDSTNNFGYVFDDNADPVSTHIGLAILSDGRKNFFAMNDKGTNNPTISWDGFTDEEKWTSLTNGIKYSSTGPNDISLVISTGPFNLQPNVKHNFDFLIAAGDDLTKLTQTVISAKQKYGEVLTSIDFTEETVPDKLELFQNYPNPFNPTTIIKYSIPKNEKRETSNIKLMVYDVLGKEIRTLLNQKQNPGNYEINFDASDLSSGIYFYKLTYGNFISTKKMILLR